MEEYTSVIPQAGEEDNISPEDHTSFMEYKCT